MLNMWHNNKILYHNSYNDTVKSKKENLQFGLSILHGWISFWNVFPTYSTNYQLKNGKFVNII